MKVKKVFRKSLSPNFATLTLPLLQGFYSQRNLLLLPILSCFSLSTSPNFFPISLNIYSQTFYLYSIFTIYFSGNSPLLKSLSSTISIFSYFLTFVFTLPSNFTTTSFVFFKFFFLF